MFNSIRRSIAALINPSNTLDQVKADNAAAYADAITDKLAKQKADKAAYLAREAAPAIAAPRILGEISAHTINQMGSEKGKQALLQFGAWMALSSAFSAYGLIRSAKRPNEKVQARFNQACNDFHGWNSLAECGATGLDIEETVARLTIPRVKKSNAQTDAIVARIRGKSVDELALEREIKAELASHEAEANANGFIMELEGFAFGSDELPSMKASQVLAKAEETLVWLAGWTTPDVAELLVLEQDILMLRKVASTHQENEGDFIDGTMCADTLCRMNNR